MTRKRHVEQRFTAKQKERRTLILSGNVWLRYVDSEEDVTPAPGDLVLYLSTERDDRVPAAHYDITGYSGYYKGEVYDGKHWRLVDLEPFFPGREHHFHKQERPMDTYEVCRDILSAAAGRVLVRTYREHYEPEE